MACKNIGRRVTANDRRRIARIAYVHNRALIDLSVVQPWLEAEVSRATWYRLTNAADRQLAGIQVLIDRGDVNGLRTSADALAALLADRSYSALHGHLAVDALIDGASTLLGSSIALSLLAPPRGVEVGDPRAEAGLASRSQIAECVHKFSQAGAAVTSTSTADATVTAEKSIAVAVDRFRHVADKDEEANASSHVGAVQALFAWTLSWIIAGWPKRAPRRKLQGLRFRGITQSLSSRNGEIPRPSKSKQARQNARVSPGVSIRGEGLS
jgi:hypothetical protein